MMGLKFPVAGIFAAALSLPGRLSLHPVLHRVRSGPPFSSAVQWQGPLFCLGLELLPAELHPPPHRAASSPPISLA